uniref:Small ribosomal subunit protein bS18c n=1 Tax=Bracteacoccus aerius TaxID=50041 RepID=A0A140HAP3_9CHLO|nr:ribosomal protein S18 [Bracteacoccus aerius]AMO01242.1 ribosomal protein S18 [Bracteacoccus aerius]
MAVQKLSKGTNKKQVRNYKSGAGSFMSDNLKKSKRKILSVSQILARVRKQKQRKLDQKKRKKPIKPIIPPKSLIIILKEKPEKAVYNRRIIDYKHCGLLQRYIGLGGKILPRRQTKLSAKQQRYIAKTIKSARIMGLLPFVSKERGFFR